MLAIGLMSGTSLDGIDAALIETDGEGVVRAIAFVSEAYDDAARAMLGEAARIALTMERAGATARDRRGGAGDDRPSYFAGSPPSG